MLPPEHDLEIRSRKPARANGGNGRKPPLLFLHGGYCDSWCWEPYFLPFFASKGYAAHAVSLRGHGGSAPKRVPPPPWPFAGGPPAASPACCRRRRC